MRANVCVHVCLCVCVVSACIVYAQPIHTYTKHMEAYASTRTRHFRFRLHCGSGIRRVVITHGVARLVAVPALSTPPEAISGRHARRYRGQSTVRLLGLTHTNIVP